MAENFNNFSEVFSKIKNHGIIPVIPTVEDTSKVLPLTEALSSGGVAIAEIKFESEHTAAAIKKISSFFPDMLLIASNISTLKQVKSAAASGAKIIIPLGFNKSVVSYCMENNLAVIPECSDSEDIDEALSEGVEVIGFLLAKKTGGIDALKELSAKYPQIRFILRGGINADNLADFLSYKSVMACRTSCMCEEEYIIGSEFPKIKSLTSQAIYKMLGYTFSHVVINCEQREQADHYSGKIESLFGFKKSDDGVTVSNAGIMHFMTSKSYYGKNGQLAISTNFMDRAVFYLKEGKHQDLIEESARFDADGELVSIYLDSMIGGFAIKVVKK